MKQLILRADDLGISEAVNYGIEKSVKEGLIGSVGLMPNMPSAKHGLELLKGTNVSIGQHTNVCLGKPLCNPKEIPSLVDENGYLKSSKTYREAFLKGEEIVTVEDAIKEIEAQYIRFKELVGKDPDYFEAHAVMSKNLFIALEYVAEKYHLPEQKLNFSKEPTEFNHMPIIILPMGSMNQDYDPFACLKDAITNHAREDMPNVFVCHPGYLDHYLLTHSSLTINRTKEVEMLCDPSVKEWLSMHDVEFIKYKDLL